MNAIDTLKKKDDFDALFKRGKSAGSRHVVVVFRKNGLSENREAFIASKKVGNSVERNRALRLMKEAYRQLGCLPEGAYDIAFIARKGIAESKCADVKKSIEAAMRRAGLAGQVKA